ncbi:YHS domain-containing (seleno)protein [Rhodovarius crocodyli]|nr:YHS domain-containing (seleno)protein [Rhodovarius crocodyli]
MILRRAALALLALLPSTAFARQNLTRGLAIQGYDPVAYFTENRARRGRYEISTRWNGATWRFATAEHRRLFLEDPARYAPAYGGFCAYAVSEGYTATVDPTAFTIVDGRLYLNYSHGVQARWRENRDERIRRADGNWPGLSR